MIDGGENVKIVILAAGKGVRMKSEEPKALTLFKGKYFLRHVLEAVKSLELPNKPLIVVGYKKERIMEALGSENTYVFQDEQLGTGHALKIARDVIDPKLKIILVLSADQPLISKDTLEQIIDKQMYKKPALTMATVNVPDFADWRAGINNFGRVIRGSDGAIKKIVEYKDATDEEKKIKELNPAIYAFNAEWLGENIHKISNDNAQKEFYLTDLVKLAGEQNQSIQGVPLAHIHEALQPNSKEEVEVLETLAPKI